LGITILNKNIMEFQQGFLPIFKTAPVWGKILMVAFAVALVCVAVMTFKP